MLVEIDQETLDRVFRQTLVEDLKRIQDEIDRLKSRETLPSHLEQDLRYNKKMKKACELLIRYNFSYEEVVEILGKKKVDKIDAKLSGGNK